MSVNYGPALWPVIAALLASFVVGMSSKEKNQLRHAVYALCAVLILGSAVVQVVGEFNLHTNAVVALALAGEMIVGVGIAALYILATKYHPTEQPIKS